MSDPTATVLHESVLLMKHTPSDIGRITDALFMADDRTLSQLPHQAFQHYFDEVGIVVLNWMGRGEFDPIQEALESLTNSVFSEPEMKHLPNLTIRQRIGLQLRVICAQMTLYLKVQNSVRYNATLTGVRNEVSRTVLRVLYIKAEESAGFGYDFGGIDYKSAWKEALSLLPAGRNTVKENIHHHLRELVKKGLALEERVGGTVKYQLSDRGLREARFHFARLPSDMSKPTASVVYKKENETATTPFIDNTIEQLNDGKGAILILLISKKNHPMSKICRLVESANIEIVFISLDPTKTDEDGKSRLMLKLDLEDTTHVVSVLERSGCKIEFPLITQSVEMAH